MAQAESRWHIPKREQIRAKSGDCSAFRGGRIYKEPLVEWLRDHPAKAGDGQAENIRTERVRKQVEKLALADEDVIKFLAGQPVKKIIVVPGRIINVVV